MTSSIALSTVYQLGITIDLIFPVSPLYNMIYIIYEHIKLNLWVHDVYNNIVSQPGQQFCWSCAPDLKA